MNNQPIKHHFSPAFSNTPWAVNNDQLCEMRLVNGIVARQWKHTNATGYQKHLYRTEGLPPGQEQHVEVNFMKPLDTAATLVLQRLLSGDRTPLDEDQRIA